MPDQRYSGDYFMKLLRNLYRRAGVTEPVTDFNTLQQLVDTERAEYEKMRSWIRLTDNRIGAEYLDFTIRTGLISSSTTIVSSTPTYLTFTQGNFEASRKSNMFSLGNGSDYIRFNVPIANQLMVLMGFILWNGSGLSLYGEQYDSSDAQIGGADFASFSMTGNFWLPYVTTFRVSELATSLRIYGSTTGSNTAINMTLSGILLP